MKLTEESVSIRDAVALVDRLRRSKIVQHHALNPTDVALDLLSGLARNARARGHVSNKEQAALIRAGERMGLSHWASAGVVFLGTAKDVSGLIEVHEREAVA